MLTHNTQIVSTESSTLAKLFTQPPSRLVSERGMTTRNSTYDGVAFLLRHVQAVANKASWGSLEVSVPVELSTARVILPNAHRYLHSAETNYYFLFQTSLVAQAGL